MTTILASGSPRRKEILEMLGVQDLLILPAKGEEIPPEGAGPAETVEVLSMAKAREVAALRQREGCNDDLIIAADTIVWHENRIFGKPHSQEEAKAMLRSLSGRTHEVYTGIALICRGRELRGHERTAVTFRPMTEEEICAYVATGEPMDKAGAYGAQGKGAVYVTGIEGDFFNVMGLPVCRLALMLKETGAGLI